MRTSRVDYGWGSHNDWQDLWCLHEAEPQLGAGVVRFWCELHQIDLLMQDVFELAIDKTFLSLLTKRFGYLCREQNLLSGIRKECSKFCTVPWLSMGKGLALLTLHQVAVTEYLTARAMSWAADNLCWVFVTTIHALVYEANSEYTELQDLTTLLWQQREQLKALAYTYCTISQIQRTRGDGLVAQTDPNAHLIHSSFIVACNHAHSCMNGLGRCVLIALNEIYEDSQAFLTRSFANVLVKLPDGISTIVAERDFSNDAGETLPAVLTHKPVRYASLGIEHRATSTTALSRFQVRSYPTDWWTIWLSATCI